MGSGFHCAQLGYGARVNVAIDLQASRAEKAKSTKQYSPINLDNRDMLRTRGRVWWAGCLGLISGKIDGGACRHCSSFLCSFLGSGGSYDSDILYLYTLEGFLNLATLC